MYKHFSHVVNGHGAFFERICQLVTLSVSLQCLKDGHDFFSRLLLIINVIDIFCTFNRLFGQI